MKVALKKIVFSHHAYKRLREMRQDSVTEFDVRAACHKASEILTAGIPEPLKLHGFQSKKGIHFDIVVVDVPEGLLIVTVIGHRFTKKYGPQYKTWKSRRAIR